MASLRTNIVTGDPDLAGILNEERVAINALSSGSTFGYVFAETQGVNGALLSDRANWATSLPDNSATWGPLLQYAHDNGLKIWTRHDRAYDVKGFSAVDINVRTVGGGTFVIRPNPKADGYFATIRHNPLAANFGIAVTSHTDALLPNNTGTPSASEFDTLITLTTSSNLAKFAHGDVWKITGNSTYTWGTGTSSLAGGNVWKGEQFDVMGVLFPVASSTIREGDVVVGATSGASGTVGSINSGAIILKMHTGTFTASESLTVGGTAKGTMNGAGKVLVRGRLKDSYSGTVTLGKMRSDLHVELDIVLDTLTDPDITLGDDDKRNNALSLYGCVEPRGTVRVRAAYATEIFQASVHRSQIELHSRRGVNNASTSNAAATEGAYGYGFEVTGSTKGGLYRGTGERMRHWFTTNPLIKTSYPTSNDVYWHFIGAVRECDVSANVWASWAAALDNHVGAYDLYYHDSTIDTTGVSGGRYFAGRESLQNRSCNTTYERIRVIGQVSNGINDLSLNKDWGQPSKTRMVDCHFDSILINIYAVESTPLAANSFEIIRGFFGMTQLTSTQLGEGSIGIDIPAANGLLKDVIIKNANLAAVNITTGLSGAKMMLDGIRFDQRSSPATGAYFVRLAATGLTVEITDLGVYENPDVAWATATRAAIHVVSGTPTVSVIGRPWAMGGGSFDLPVLTPGSAAVATGAVKSPSVSRNVYYTGTAWPARPSGNDPVTYISTKVAAAASPTDRVIGDMWLRHPDALS